jgi:hypothetical protein
MINQNFLIFGNFIPFSYSYHNDHNMSYCIKLNNNIIRFYNYFSVFKSFKYYKINFYRECYKIFLNKPGVCKVYFNIRTNNQFFTITYNNHLVYNKSAGSFGYQKREKSDRDVNASIRKLLRIKLLHVKNVFKTNILYLYLNHNKRWISYLTRPLKKLIKRYYKGWKGRMRYVMNSFLTLYTDYLVRYTLRHIIPFDTFYYNENDVAQYLDTIKYLKYILTPRIAPFRLMSIKLVNRVSHNGCKTRRYKHYTKRW